MIFSTVWTGLMALEMTDMRPQDSFIAAKSHARQGASLVLGYLYAGLKRSAFGLKCAVFIGVAYLLYQQVIAKDLVYQVGQVYGQMPWQSPLLWVALGLVPVNWGLEVIRWQLLAQRIEAIPFREALSGVLVGVSLAFVTPGIIGEYAGRTLLLRSRARARSAGSMAVSNSAQFIVTLLFGGIGLLWYLQHLPSQLSGRYAHLLEGLSGSLLVVLLGLGAVLLAMYVYAGLLVSVLKTLLPSHRFAGLFQKVIAIAGEYSYPELWSVMGLSALRYLVFSMQFVLVLKAMGVGLSWQMTWAGVSLVLLAKTVIPSLSLMGDLGLRELSALVYFSQYGESGAVVVGASLMIWAVNIFLPAMLGLGLILRIRLWSSTTS